MVADLHPVGGPPPQEVQVVDDEQAHLAGQERVQGAAREISSVTPRRAGVSEEVQQRDVEVTQGRVPAERDTTDRPALVALTGPGAVLGDLAQMELLRELLDGRTLAETGRALDGDSTFGAVVVVQVAVHDVPQRVVQSTQLRRPQDAHVRVPVPSLLVVVCLS